ncbi:MAG: transposase [Candidatus Omnitrophica bacterium]|nr:transposase [Candidatus Omnitrophota bacterium]
MPRIGRIVAVGLPHHITQRGNYQQKVFVNEDDRKQYLHWIQMYSEKYGLCILAYCLMNNHVHFIAIPAKEDSLCKTFNTAHMRYSQYFNRKLKQRGHLWQGRFYSCVLDEPHLILAARYIERNPVRAGLVQQPWQWPWSSALAHIAQKEADFIGLNDFLKIVGKHHGSWKAYIGFTEELSFLHAIRKNTLTGRPLGTIPFIKALEEKFHRSLSALPTGRPKRT